MFYTVKIYFQEILTELCGFKNEVAFKNINFRKHLFISKGSTLLVNVSLQLSSGLFEFWRNGEEILTGQLMLPLPTKKFIERNEMSISETCLKLSKNEIYREMEQRGHTYHEPYKNIEHLNITDTGKSFLLFYLSYNFTTNCFEHFSESIFYPIPTF